ncbi:hypothetical protein, partial [Bacillus cereus group sp. BC16]|uniref:hypothetical protein n=1 Tax=Bacillus cereus group sp. BC16 TaxID=3445346 RepID=UPI003F695723
MQRSGLRDAMNAARRVPAAAASRHASFAFAVTRAASTMTDNPAVPHEATMTDSIKALLKPHVRDIGNLQVRRTLPA